MKRNQEFAILRREVFGQRRIEKVRVLARAEGYAMVRLPQAMPFAVDEKELSPVTPEAEKPIF